MGMFPRMTTAEHLESVPKRYGDVKSAVAQIEPGRYCKGQCWNFWMEDDPRKADGILQLARYRCYESGHLDSKWELVE